jgi:hypothetical protein
MLLVVGLAAACAAAHVESAPGLNLSPSDQNQLAGVVDTGTFWRPSCAKSQIVVQRVDPSRRLVELSICQEVRRYQRFGPFSNGGEAWLDVTRATETEAAASRSSS